uniref:ceramidase n=1 Tax=Alexandrium andersonii TaxID=327968 RepID=A0A7S2D1S5_9DINO|mmetsp:Transcript_46409/g.105275  ORF Transcript_46409/g.105275 Transcript_46409/m.105275 type:complete len:313 (+) Transcript_46409:168-1106(+)
MREARQLVADINDPRVTLDNVFALNLRYELSGLAESPAGLQDTFATMDLQTMFSAPTEGCSGLLAAMPNGTVVHGRNMDYAGFEIPQPDGRVYHWPEVTTEVIFLKQGKPLFISVHWPGLLGVHTGMRFGGWTLEQNTRYHSVEPDILYGLLDKSKGFVFEARKALETVPDFETAVQTMYGVDYMAPMYFIMSGAKPYEGAILTIDRGGVHSPNSPQIMRLNQETTAIKDGKPYEGWHILQTNDDLNGLPLDTRRPVEEKRLSSSAQDSVGVPWVLDQMLTAPILQDSTVFTTVYVVASGYHRTIAHLGSLR